MAASLSMPAWIPAVQSSFMVEAPESRRRLNDSDSPTYPNGSSHGGTLHEASTNTLIVTRVPPSLLQSSAAPSLRDFFASYGNIEAWIPLTSFERIVVVYTHDSDAERAKLGLDFTLVQDVAGTAGSASPDQSSPGSVLRVYRGNPTSLDMLRNRHLRDTLPVPNTDKNFLISPPGSPPVGWEQIREDPPNMDTLADDLARALELLSTAGPEGMVEEGSNDFLQHQEDRLAMDEDDASASASRLEVPPSPRDTLIIPHRRTESGDLPSVLVSDTDIDVPAESTRTGLSISDAFAIQRRTHFAQRPNGPISQVKATVESMRDPPNFEFPLGSRIDRTPRPPVA